jgi:heme-degrading monooxygenase HmoA
MAIRVLISRKVPASVSGELKPLLLKLRSLAMTQPGYISGETLVNAADHEDFLVLSSWISIEHWNAWVSNPARLETEREIERLLGVETVQKVYSHG